MGVLVRHPPRPGCRRCRLLRQAEFGRRSHERCRRLCGIGHGSQRCYGTLSCDMNTTHGLRRLHRCFAAVRATFADVDHVIVADDAELAAATAASGV